MKLKLIRLGIFLLNAFIVSLIIIAALLVVLFTSATYSSYKRSGSLDLTKFGHSQDSLRMSLSSHIGIELTGDIVIENARTAGRGRNGVWYEISFEPSKSLQLKEMLLQKEYKEVRFPEGRPEFRKNAISIQLARIPKSITSWWNAARLEKTTMFVSRLHDNNIECFLNEEEGILLIWIVDYR